MKIDTTETKVTAENIHEGGGGAVDEGKALLFVTSVEDRGDSIMVKYEVLAHEVDGNVGRRMTDFLRGEGKGADRSIKFAYATGILSREDYAAQTAVGYEVDVPWENANQQKVCTTVTHYKRRAQCGWDFVRPGTDEATKGGYPTQASPEKVAAPAEASGPGQDEGTSQTGSGAPF